MFQLGSEISKVVKETFFPLILQSHVDLFEEGLQLLNIELAEHQKNSIKQQLSSKSKHKKFTLSFTDEQVEASQLCESELHSAIQDLFAQVEVQVESKIAEVDFNSIIHSEVHDYAQTIVDSLKDECSSFNESRRVKLEFFEAEYMSLWIEPLDFFEAFIEISGEFSQDIFNQRSKDLEIEKSFTWDALIRLVSRGIQIASEVLALLRNGFADGAYARWRSLHEVTVVASFIHMNGDETAEKYLLHEVMEEFQVIKQRQDFASKFDLQQVDPSYIDAVTAQRDILIQRFGESYTDGYGWAAGIIPTKKGKNQKPRFSHIEEFVRLDTKKLDYQLSSKSNVHAGSKGVFFKLGYPEQGKGSLLSGPSNIGLSVPGILTVESLSKLISTISKFRRSSESFESIDRMVIIKILTDLKKLTIESFQTSNEVVESYEAHSF